MPDDRDEIRYTATITHDTGGLFDTMEATVEIPVRRVNDLPETPE